MQQSAKRERVSSAGRPSTDLDRHHRSDSRSWRAALSTDQRARFLPESRDSQSLAAPRILATAAECDPPCGGVSAGVAKPLTVARDAVLEVQVGQRVLERGGHRFQVRSEALAVPTGAPDHRAGAWLPRDWSSADDPAVDGVIIETHCVTTTHRYRPAANTAGACLPTTGTGKCASYRMATNHAPLGAGIAAIEPHPRGGLPSRGSARMCRKTRLHNRYPHRASSARGRRPGRARRPIQGNPRSPRR